MDTNNSYVTALGGFTDAAFYESAAGEFNPGPGEAFGACCLFWLEGLHQDVGDVDAPYVPLMSNFNGTNDGGWELGVFRGGGADPALAFTVATGAGFTLVLKELNDPGARGYCEQLILAGGWYDPIRGMLFLTVNGKLISRTAGGADPYSPSATTFRLGGSQAGIASTFPSGRIVSAGFSSGILSSDTAIFPGQIAGRNFRAAREQMSLGYFEQQGSLDWPNRYEASESKAQTTLTRTESGAYLTALPEAPAELSNVGASGIANPGTPFVQSTGVLTRNGALNTTSVKNPTWYASLGELAVFAPP